MTDHLTAVGFAGPQPNQVEHPQRAWFGCGRPVHLVFAASAPPMQAGVQPSGETSPTVTVDRLIDRLVRHVRGDTVDTAFEFD